MSKSLWLYRGRFQSEDYNTISGYVYTHPSDAVTVATKLEQYYGEDFILTELELKELEVLEL